MCNAIAIRVWNYDCGETMDYTEDYSPELLAELKAQWDDPCNLSGAAMVCLALDEAYWKARHQLRQRSQAAWATVDVDMPF